MTTPEQLIADSGVDPSLIGMGMEELPQPIGGELPSVGPRNVLQSTGRQPSQFPGYYEGVESSLLRSMPTETLVRLQEQLLALDLTSKVVIGEIDRGTIAGFNGLLAMANLKRERWQQTLSRAVQTKQATGTAPPTPPDLYRPPNYESMAEGIKGYMRDTLRRDPTEAELALLGDKLASLHRQQFDTEVAANQMVEDNIGAGRVIEGPEPGNHMAEFRAWAENRYADEIDVVEDVDERQQSTALAGSVADSLGRIVGGGA